MKKINILQLGIAAIITTIAYSCKKDVINPNASSASSTVQQSNIMERSQTIERNLLNFKAELKNYKTQKNDEPTITYEVDSAIWYLESTLNYTYSNPTEITKAHNIDSFEVILTKTIDGKIDLSEIQRGYNESVTSLGLIYDAASYSDKVFKMSDLEVLSEDAQKVTIQVKGDVGERTDNGDKNGITSGWSWGQKKGYYHPNGQIFYAGDLDATDVIEIRANNTFNPQPTHDAYGNPITAQQGIRMIVINPVINQVNLTPFSNGMNNLIWHGDKYIGSPTLLLSNSDVATYSNGAVTIANMSQFQGSNPPPALIEVADDVIASGTNPYSVLHRINTITYGNVIWVSTLALTP